MDEEKRKFVKQRARTNWLKLILPAKLGSGLSQGMTSIKGNKQGGPRGGAGVQAAPSSGGSAVLAAVAPSGASKGGAVSSGAAAAAAGTEMVYHAGRWVPQAVVPPPAPTAEEEADFYSRQSKYNRKHTPPAPAEQQRLVAPTIRSQSVAMLANLEAVDVEVGGGSRRRPSKAALPRRR